MKKIRSKEVIKEIRSIADIRSYTKENLPKRIAKPLLENKVYLNYASIDLIRELAKAKDIREVPAEEREAQYSQLATLRTNENQLLSYKEWKVLFQGIAKYLPICKAKRLRLLNWYRQQKHLLELKLAEKCKVAYYKKEPIREKMLEEINKEYRHNLWILLKHYKRRYKNLTTILGKQSYFCYLENNNYFQRHKHKISYLRSLFLHKIERTLIDTLRQPFQERDLQKYKHNLAKRTLSTLPETYSYAIQGTTQYQPIGE